MNLPEIVTFSHAAFIELKNIMAEKKYHQVREMIDTMIELPRWDNQPEQDFRFRKLLAIYLHENHESLQKEHWIIAQKDEFDYARLNELLKAIEPTNTSLNFDQKSHMKNIDPLD